MKRGNTAWCNISFHCNVRSLSYISEAINMFKWKPKEAVVFDIIFRLIVRKIAVSKASWLTLSSTLLFAELPDLRRPVRGSPHSRVELTNYVLGIEKHAQTYHQTICLIF